jgi:uncharacterized protein
MLRKITPCFFLLAMLSLGPVLAADTDATVHQIYQATVSGHIAQAEQMVGQWVQNQPSNAEAHYVAAQVYARAGDFSTARRQLASAESLDPGLSFARPQSVAALRAELAQNRFLPRAGQQPGYGYAPYASQTHERARVPWGTILVILAGVVIIWSLVRRRMQPVYPQYPPQSMGGVGPMGTGGGVVPPYPYGGPGAGPGLMSSLGTGLAVGAGVAAGEELVRHALGGSEGGIIPPANAGEFVPGPPPVNEDMGGQDFGITEDGSGGGDPGSGDDFGIGGGDAGGGGGDWT